MENQTDFAQGQQQGQMGREQQAFQQQAQQGQQGQQQGHGRGALVALAVIGLLVGIGGAGFGVYTMTQKDETKPANLSVKIEKADGSVVELETDKIKKADDGSTITIVDSANTSKAGPYISDGYFYVPEWGWKYKLPEDLTNFGYAVDYDEAHTGYDLPFIGFTAVQKSDLVEDAQAQYYDDILTCSMVEVNKSQKDKNEYALGDFDKEIGDYKVRISTYNSNFCYHKKNIDAVQQKLIKMFQNPEEI